MHMWHHGNTFSLDSMPCYIQLTKYILQGKFDADENSSHINTLQFAFINDYYVVLFNDTWSQ